MQKKCILLLLLSALSFGQNKLSKIEKKYEFFVTKFDSLNNLKDRKAVFMLKELYKSKDFKSNDTVKYIYYNLEGVYNILNGNNENKVNNSFDKCIKLAIENENWKYATKACHNKAVSYHFRDKIDLAIKCDEKAMEFAKKDNNKKSFYISYVANARRLSYLGKYKESSDRIIKEIHNIKDVETRGVALLILTSNYNDLGDKRELDKYYLESINNLRNTAYKNLLNSSIQEYTNYLINREKFKKALIYADSIVYYSNNDDAIALSSCAKARALYGLKDFSNAIKAINEGIRLNTKNYDAYNLLDAYIVRGKIYLEKNETLLAIQDFDKAKGFFKEAQDKILEVEVLKYSIMANLKLKDNKAYNMFEEFIKLKDSIYDENQSDKMLRFEADLKTAEKEFKIKSQQLQIQKEKANKYMAFGGIGLLLLLSGGGYFWFRSKQNQTNLKAQNTLLGLQQNLMEAELSNLNKQLDPHEIKNLLASISPEIQDKAPESYRKMLKLFNLTKASLNSSSITDSIENQLQQIDDFLSLEKSMLPIPLEYSIENKTQNIQTQIPRLLLKNLVENAIKHGIKPQETGGNIFVKVEEKDNFIHISVDDTGKGRNLAISLDSGIGTTTYQKLFSTLNPKNKEKATFEIIDKPQGTKVEVRIPTNYKYD